MYKIAIIEKIHEDGLKILDLNSNYEYEIITDVSEQNLIKKLPDFDACTLRVSKLNENILKHCPKLKVISRHGVGFDNVDLPYIKKRHFIVNYSNSQCGGRGRACFIHDDVNIKRY